MHKQSKDILFKEFLTKNLKTLLLVLVLFSGYFALPNTCSSSSNIDLFEEALSSLKNYYYNPQLINRFLNERVVQNCERKISTSYQNAIECLTNKVKDPYTKYLLPEEANRELKRIKTVSTGIGISVDPIEPSVIVNVQKNSPADNAGIKQNDLILAINQTPIEYLSSEEIDRAIRHADVGEITSLDLKRGYMIFSAQVPMKEIESQSVRSKLLENKILYIKIDDLLSKKAPNEIEQILRSSEAKESIGIIVDLRANKGGLLKNGLKIADMFLPNGRLLTIRSQRGQRHFIAKADNFYSNPIVILIDGQTASASEVIASALKDNNVATLIGTKTFGKGLIQQIKTLSDGSALHITVSKFYTPEGKAINRIGIMPNIYVRDNREQLEAAIGYLNTIHKTI